MQYLIFYAGSAFYTKWFDAENNFVRGMVVFDLHSHKYTTNGTNWETIDEDHL